MNGPRIWKLMQGLAVTGTAAVPGTATEVSVESGTLAKIFGVSVLHAGTAAPAATHQFRLKHELNDDCIEADAGYVTLAREGTADEDQMILYTLIGW